MAQEDTIEALVTDRPDATESPSLVRKNFLQIETDGPGKSVLARKARSDQAPIWSELEYEGYLKTIEPFIRPTCEYLGYSWNS